MEKKDKRFGPKDPKSKQMQNIAQGRQTDDYKPEYCQMLIDSMSNGYSLAAFSADIKKSRKIMYIWMDKYPEFAEAYETGKSAAQKFFETLAINCSMGTIPERLKKLGSKRLDPFLISFFLKTRFRADYSEKQIIDHQNSDGSLAPSITVNIVRSDEPKG